MRRNNVITRILPVIFISSSLCAISSGCALLPRENTGYALPTVAALEIPDYEMTTITRKDIVSSKVISCVYSGSTRTELAFDVNGINLEDIYVEKGEKVSKGDLLALLNTGDLEERTKALETTIFYNEFELAQKQELLELESNKINTQYKYGQITAKARDAKLSELKTTYDTTDLEQTLYYDKLEYEALLGQLNSARIYAPYDGMIVATNLNYYNNITMKPNKNKLSIKGDTVITMSETTETKFKVTTDYCKYFETGDIIDITMTRGGTGTYSARVELDPSDSAIMYVYPLEDIGDLEYGARAEFILVLDKRENVLAVESSVIKSSGDKKYIYYINEDGYRGVRFIETGLKGDDGYTEIISGVEYGEAIIKSVGGADE